MAPSGHRLAYLAWVTICLVWGTTYLGIRIALETVPVAAMGAIRWTVAGAVLGVVLVLGGRRLPPRATWWPLCVTGTLMIGVGNGLVVWAEQFVPSGLAAVMIATSPFWMAGVEAALGGERLTARALAGLAVGFAGILVLVWPDLRWDGAAGVWFGAGVVALQLACLGWALGSSYSRRHSRGGDVLAATTLQMLCGGVLMAVVATLTGEWDRLDFSVRTAAAMIWLTAVGSVVAFAAYTYALAHLPIATVSLYAYINPIIAVILGALVLDEPFTARTVVAMTIIFTGVALVRSVGRSPSAVE